MAAATPSPLASSVEKTNGAKLSRLLIDGGTTVLGIAFDSCHPPANLAADLNANYLTLKILLRKRVLRTAQWDQLFPPGGATPDSKTFDITLLFLLLTNICGLTPPPSGWHVKPPPSDTSREANLARIKFFRNELYGHVTTTCVDTLTFNALWLEISAVLVPFGLDQAEIDRLKAERRGEEDYLDALLDWADSEEDIKSQLKEMRQCQTETQQDVGKVLETQLEDRKTLEDSKAKLDEVHQTQTSIQRNVERVHQTQLEDRKTLEDSKAKLDEVHQTQTNIQGNVERVHQTQLEDRKTLEDSKAKLDEVHQTQTNIQGNVERVHQTQLEDRKTLEDSKAKLDEVHQTQTNIQGNVERIHQTQLEDRKTLEDSKAKLDEVHQTQTNIQGNVERVHQTQSSIQGTVKRVCQTQLEDHETLQDNKSMLQEVRQTQTKTQEIVERVVKTQEEHFETLQEVKQTVDSLKDGKDKNREEEVLRTLAKSEFKGDIEYHVGRFQEGTREWVFNKVQDWLDDRNSQNRVMVISADAGMGKSVISAVICKRMQEADRLSGSHFCQHNNARYRNPQLMLQSLACHLCHALPEYKQALVKQLSRNLGKDLNIMGVEELFALLFKEPLSTVADPRRNMLMVIDGLDESEFQERNELLDVIANHFCKLPCWIRFLCTTRPERNFAEALKQLKPFQLEPNKEENVQDIKLFLEKKMQCLMRQDSSNTIVEKLVKKSEGLMLYAYFLVLFIEENVSVLDKGDLDGSLPLAISSVYHSYFKRLEYELIKELGVKEENFLSLLCAVTASREPLPVDFVSKVLVPSANSPVARRKVLKAIGSVSSLLPVRGGCLHVIHKSVKDWLTDTSCFGEHDFIIDEKEGHRILSSLCSEELDNLKQKGVHDTEFSSTAKYALNHGVRHMLQLDENMGSRSLEECVQTYVLDLELLYAKLCFNNSIAVEDILWLQNQEISQGLSDDSKGFLNTFKFLLRKYFNTFTNHPHVCFETMLNEGGAVLSSVASNLLKNKYPEIPYMELIHKQMQQGAVLARFQCSSEVACLDVSPQLDYMVCECKDGTIQLWSLHTGKLVWTRPVRVKKHYSPFSNALRNSHSYHISFYRSVIFHPTEEVVLPGVLSYAYTFDGDLKPLFLESKCTFTVCSVSGNKTTMLTDCPDDAKSIILWSLENGSEITRTTRKRDVLSFAWSRDGKLLAISHIAGSIAIVDAMESFRTLAKTVMPEVCGMIKMSPDCRSLFCNGGKLFGKNERFFRLNLNMELGKRKKPSYHDCESFVPWDCESHSETGFLLGDPISSDYGVFDFVLNEQSVLRGYFNSGFIDMLNISELRKKYGEASFMRIGNITFSLSGDTVYVVGDATETTVSAWNVSSGELITEKSIRACYVLPYQRNCLVTVKEGVLLVTRSGTLELWNSELSQCVRNWTDVNRITRVIPMSEERVACEAKKQVIILDTTSGEIVSTIPTSHDEDLLACNSKYQLLTYRSRSLQFSDGRTTIWRKRCRLARPPRGMFSLSEQFVVILAKSIFAGEGVCVHDAISGETLHILREDYRHYLNCIFISDEECVISSKAAPGDCFLQLFNVKSGDLLSVLDLETEANCLVACPRKRLLAIATRDSKHGFNLITVQLPQDKDIRKSKR